MAQCVASNFKSRHSLHARPLEALPIEQRIEEAEAHLREWFALLL